MLALGMDPKAEGARDAYRAIVGDTESAEDRLFWSLGGSTPAFAPLLGLLVKSIPTSIEDSLPTERGEQLLRRTIRIVERWGDPGVLALVELMVAGKVDNDYSFREMVKAAARKSEALRAELARRSEAGSGFCAEMLEESREDEGREDLDVLFARLRSEVFPGEVFHQAPLA
jgi:hypothetical protein